jgi:hypothetical protein
VRLEQHGVAGVELLFGAPAAEASASMVIRRCWRRARTLRPTAVATSSGDCMETGVPYFGGYSVVLPRALDTAANVLFLLATRLGSLGVSAVVVSLYPVVVVLLARVVLRERLTGMQLTSVGLALGASVLLSASG